MDFAQGHVLGLLERRNRNKAGLEATWEERERKEEMKNTFNYLGLKSHLNLAAPLMAAED